MPRFLGIDYGTKRIGLSVSDPDATIASPLRTVESRGDAGQDAMAVAAVAREYEVDELALAVDSDGDGLPDYWEQGTGLDYNDATGEQGEAGDPDDDGLSNGAEHERGTRPLQADTDGDGVIDSREVTQGTDPLNPGSRLATLFLPLVARQSP